MAEEADRSGLTPINLADMEHTARDIGGVSAEAIRESRGHGKVGFALMLFDFGPGGNSTYVSNAERADMIQALEELLGHLKAGTDEPPIGPFAAVTAWSL